MISPFHVLFGGTIGRLIRTHADKDAERETDIHIEKRYLIDCSELWGTLHCFHEVGQKRYSVLFLIFLFLCKYSEYIFNLCAM